MFRERSQTNNDQVQVATLRSTLYQGTCANPTATSVTDTNYNVVPKSEFKLMQDFVIPQFKSLSARGMIFNNPCYKQTIITNDMSYGYYNSHRHKNWTNCSGVYKWLYNSGYTYSGYGQAAGICQGKEIAAPAIDTESLINLAVTQAWANTELSQAAAMMTLAEGEKTIQSLIAIFGRLIKIVLKIKNLQFRSLLHEFSPKELQQRYMEVRYALRPLIYEAKGITDALSFEKGALGSRLTFRGYQEQTAENTSSLHQLLDGNNRYRDYEMKTTRIVTVRSGVLTKIKAISSLNNWGFDQIFETMWEVTPFSFIIDWFFNIGQTIASWTPEGGLETLSSWYTLEDKVHQSVKMVGTGVTGCVLSGTCLENTFSLSPCEWSREETIYSRVPDPRRQILPTFKLRLDAAKLLDLVIIAKQIMFRK